jgi:hypothetical protein
MIPSRWDRPGQSAQGSVSPTQAWFAANAARICGKPRSTSVLPFHGYRAWCTMVHQTRNLSDATPIARGNTPLTIPVLTTGIGACATDRRLCPTLAKVRSVSPCSALHFATVRSGIHTNAPLNERTFIGRGIMI